jgi:hypothetical protein
MHHSIKADHQQDFVAEARDFLLLGALLNPVQFRIFLPVGVVAVSFSLDLTAG